MMKKQLLCFALLFNTMLVNAQTLVTGGQFMDLLLPMEGSVAATASDWGTTSGENTQYSGTWEGTLGRWKDNGIEDTERSYWGANIVKDSDGKYHMYVAGWPSATCGHMQWSSKSMVYHVVSDNVWGPYTYVGTLGTGHNPEIYKTGDTYVIYKIEPLGYYKSATLGDTWETGEYTFDLRDRILIAGENRETSLSNCSFAKREDGSFVMIDRGGGIWVSRDGLTDPWHQLTDASVYLNSEITNRGSLEDPVIWRDHLQYHMVVNDWRARYAYYYRSLDGLHWVKEAGKAYTGQDPFAKHADGTVEKWHKYERPRVYQDELGRAIRMNFAVIDCVKQSDLAGDDHSSKNINMPLTKQLLLEVQTISSTSATVLVKAEVGFNPKTDLNFSTLKFGSHDKVNYGNGFTYASHAESGNDVIITFTGSEGSINAGEWAPKMLGQKADGSIAFGYAKMPNVDYKPAMLSAVTPTFAADGTVQTVSITNYGQSTSVAATVRVYNQTGTTLLAHGTTSALAAYASETVTLTKDAAAAAGYTSIQVRFYNGETLLNTENIPLTAINAAQAALQNVINEANTLYNDATLTEGKTTLKTAIDNATAVVACYNVTTLEAQQEALSAAMNTFKYANASPTNGLSITIPNATCDDLSEWTMTRLEANNAPGWKLNTSNRYGFDGNFIEMYKAGGLGVANNAHQTLSDMPAGRYRLRVKVLATNNGSAATGVTFYASGTTLTGSQVSQNVSTGKDECTEYMLELTLTSEGSIEFGIDIASTTNATWVCFDNWSLKYFGTQEGIIVEEQPEPLSFDQSKVYRIKWKPSGNYSKVYWRSPKYNTDGDANLHRTANVSEAAQFIIRSVTGTEGQFYLYDVVSHQYVVPSANATNGTAWTVSATTPGKTVITEHTSYFSISSTAGGEANAYANDNNDGDIKNYSGGSQWLIEEAGDNTATMGINTQAVYHLQHLNTARPRYMAATPNSDGYLLTTNTEADKGEFSLLPVSGKQGYYYIYNKEGYFVTPSTTSWTLSQTTPAEVKVELNIDNMDAIGTTSVTFLLGENNQHANPQNKNSTELIYAYSNHETDKGNNWVLEPVSGASAVLPISKVTTGIQDLVSSAAAENITIKYTATIGTEGLGTLVVPFNAEITEGGVEAYQLTGVQGTNILAQKLTTIQANEPVLLKNQGTLELTSLTGTAAYTASPVSGVLTGVYTSTTAPQGSYVLQMHSGELAFYQVGSTTQPTIAPFHAYLTANNNARALQLIFADATGIDSHATDTWQNEGECYDLQGRRANNNQSGILLIRSSQGTVKKMMIR